jgi:hypothetical protein
MRKLQPTIWNFMAWMDYKLDCGSLQKQPYEFMSLLSYWFLYFQFECSLTKKYSPIIRKQNTVVGRFDSWSWILNATWFLAFLGKRGYDLAN